MMSTFYNNAKTAVLLGLMTGLILFIGYLIGGRGALVPALIIAGIMNFVSYFFSAKIALASMRAQEVGPDHELYQIVEGMVQRSGMPMPKVYVSPTPAPNAFATGRNPQNAAVCATEGLLRTLDRNEVAGVMAHELAHVKHRDILIQTVAATVGGAISMLGYMFMFGGGGRHQDDESPGGNALAALVIFIVGPIAASLIQMAISRSREYNADKVGAEICGNPMWLATALEKIHLMAKRVPLQVNPSFNSMFIAEPLNAVGGASGLANLFQTHPPLEKRLMNLIGRETTGAFAIR